MLLLRRQLRPCGSRLSGMRLAVVENCLKSTTTNPEAFRCLSERNTRLYQFAGFLLLRRRQFELGWRQSLSSGLQFDTILLCLSPKGFGMDFKLLRYLPQGCTCSQQTVRLL
jgi:hypothetical protein